jgi:TRAP-type C4-dicarboxylate transport system substrate-binding protein
MIARRVSFGSLIAVIAAGVMMLGATPAMAKKTFRWGDSCFNNLRADYYGYHRFLDLVEERTGGNITFKRIGKAVLGNEPQRLEATQKGTLDVTHTFATILSQHSKAAGALILPFLFNLPDDMVWNIVSPEVRELLDVCEDEAGIKILTIAMYEERHFFNNVRPIKKLEDVKGLRIRTMASQDEQYWVSLTGARPTPTTFPELYQMLKSGVVEGYDGNFTVHDSMKYYEVQKYASIMGYHYIVPMIIMSWKAWNGLTPEEQNIFIESSKQAVLENYPQARRMVERARLVAVKNGNVIDELEDIEKWREIVKPAYEKKMEESPAAKKFVEAVWKYHKEYPLWPTDLESAIPQAKY